MTPPLSRRHLPTPTQRYHWKVVDVAAGLLNANFSAVRTTPGCGSTLISNEIPVTVTSVPAPTPVTVTFYSVAAEDGRLWESGETGNIGGGGNSTDNTTAALRMPPSATNKSLSAGEIDILQRWIEQALPRVDAISTREALARVDVTHIPYKGGGPALAARAREHFEGLLREFALIAAGTGDEAGGHQVPARLTELVTTITAANVRIIRHRSLAALRECLEKPISWTQSWRSEP